MTAGLITFFRHHHYGAQLQAYAAMRAITELGVPCQIIDYRPDYDAGLNDLFRKGSLRAQLSNLHTAAHYAAMSTRARRFDDFVRENMVLTDRCYTSLEQLQADPPPFDVYVSGSDQIWNPNIFPGGSFDPAYLLSFVRQGRKISYASSLGVPTLPPDKARILKEHLSTYSAVAVREKRGQTLLREAAGVDSRVVLDPTLLLDGKQWGDLAQPPRDTAPYILCYFISDPGEVFPYVQALAQKTGYPIVQLAGARKKLPGAREIVFDAGPREFLGLFQNAAYVCTNSFHGSVFSLQFDKPFFTSMSPKERSEPTYSRIYNLLGRLGCADRIVGLETTAAVDAPMDYEAIHKKLDSARADSAAYLKAALAGAPSSAEEDSPIPPRRPTLAPHDRCTGCSACAAACPVKAISVTADKEGFLRPVISDACVLCRKCESVCPDLTPPQTGPSPTHVWAVWNKDDAVRENSSSGGVFSLLADHTLARGGAVFGCVLEDGKARHVCARTPEELSPMRGSKYVQSDLNGCFPQIKALLDKGTPVLFSGVPCQVDGLRRYLGKDDENLLTCDLVCHGVPSPAVFSAYLASLEKSHGAKAVNVRFKDKSHGWQHPHFTVEFANGSRYSEDFNKTAYGRGFGMQLFLRPSCANCLYTHPGRRPADFTLADYWGLDPALELPTAREKGISMVMVNTPRGEALFEKLRPRLDCVERPLDEATAGNPRLMSPLKANPRRAAFFSAFRVLPFEEVQKQFLALPSLPYRMAAKVLTPGMKDTIRKILK